MVDDNHYQEDAAWTRRWPNEPAAKLITVLTTIEAEVDEKGNIRPRKPVVLPPGSRVLVTVLSSEEAETARLSEAALGSDWQRPEEDVAWSHLSPDS
jgi:hypothetical protein